MVVRVTVVLTLISLGAAFGVLFLHNWRLWDQTVPGAVVTLKPGLRNLSDSEDDTDEELYQEVDPMLKPKLMATRRKSVAFSVCVVDRENMTFDLDRKRVMLGLSESSLLPTLAEDSELSSVPLVLPGPRAAPARRFNTSRRMSVPAVCLNTKTLGTETDAIKKFTSSETII